MKLPVLTLLAFVGLRLWTVEMSGFSFARESLGSAISEVTIFGKDLNEAAKAAVDSTSKDFLIRKILDSQGKLSLSMLKINKFVKPTSDVKIVKNVGLRLSLRKGEVSVESDWTYSKKIGSMILQSSGSFAASAGFTLDVEVSLGAVDGRPTAYAHACSTSLTDLKMEVIRSWASPVYNLLISSFENAVRSKLESVACDSARRAVDRDGTEVVEALIYRAQIDSHKWTAGYRLVGDPRVTDDFVRYRLEVGTFTGDSFCHRAGADLCLPLERTIF